MDEKKPTKSDPHDHYDHLPKDVLNKVQDPDSFRDPLEVQKEKEERMAEENRIKREENQ